MSPLRCRTAHDVIEDTAATHEQTLPLPSPPPPPRSSAGGGPPPPRTQHDNQKDNLPEKHPHHPSSQEKRVLLVPVSDSLNMRTMEYQSPAKQKQKSLETMEIYAPISHRLGMQRIKWELEDLSLKYLDPIGYDEIVSKLDAKRQEYEDFMRRTPGSDRPAAQ